MRRSALLVPVVSLVVAACSPAQRVAEPPKWTDAVATGSTPERPACIPADPGATRIATATARGSTIEFCVGTEGATCFSYDIASQTLKTLPTRPEVPMASSAYVLAADPSLEVCASNSCKSLASKVLPNVANIRAATNSSGSLAVFLLGDAPAGKGYAEIWDVVASKRLTSFKYARGDLKCGDVAVLGETIYLAARSCRAPTARATLYTSRGKKLANVGGSDFGVFGNAHVQLDAARWAFLEEHAMKLVVQSIATGKIEKTIALKALYENATGKSSQPGESAIVKLGDGRVAVIAGPPVTAHIALVDLESGDIDIVRPPGC